MKIDLILVSVILVVLIFFPFVLLPLIRNRDLKKLEKKLREEEKNYKINVQHKEFWNQNYMGLDLKERKLLFIQKSEQNFIVELIDLHRVAECRPVFEEFIFQKDGKTQSSLRQVYLEFSFIDSEDKKSICLFDSDLQVNQDLEVKHAREWAYQINQQLTVPATLKRTA